MARENVFARASRENLIFKDEHVLDPQHLPDALPHRETQVNALVFALKPLADGGKAAHVFVWGPPGTGKTVTLSFVMGQLKEFSSRVKPIYFNCFGYNSRQAVLAELTRQVERPVPARGMSTNELHAKVLEGLKFAPFIPVLVFDEFDQLLANDGNELLYDLLRIPEHNIPGIPIILISNDPSIPARLDARVRSSFAHEKIEFAPYSPIQLKDILRERAEKALVPGALPIEMAGLIAAHAAKRGGDCRVAIETLRKAARRAERANACVIDEGHVRAAFEDTETSAVQKAIPFLTDSHKHVLKSLFALGGRHVPSNDLYVRLASQGIGLSDRRVREILVELEKKKAITTHTDTSGRGRSKRITVNFPEAVMK
ncbi:MAG: AAA family ATPase [Candidatus Diapherotrites archaeon]|nr:AAA family ATPase [Candidatus Diapherotrites archaeon]MDZ4256837.1 AAA family ATPase [archaeon]